MHINKSALRLARDTRGANMVEYIILVGVIAMLAIAGFRLFGTAVDTKVKAQTGTVDKIEEGQ